MEITEQKNKINYNDDIKKLINIFKFKNSELSLKGSSSLSAIDYYSDYDFFTQIRANYSTDEIYDEFSLILRKILDNQDCYFIEFKLQNINGSKNKWFPNSRFNNKDFDKLFSNKTDYCKIDLVYFSDNRFIEASCIYKFYGENLTEQEYIKQIEKDIKDLKKENNFFKILKRLYSIYKIKNNENKLLLLTDIFNSKLGQIYKNLSNIDAINLVKKYYNKPLTKKRIEINISDLGYPQNYEKEYSKQKTELNKEAKKIYNEIT